MARKNFTNVKPLMPRRLRKEDIVEMLPTVALLLTNACKSLLDSNEVSDFEDREYLKYVCVEILHGERWRRVAKIHNFDDALEEVRYVHSKFREVYLKRLKDAEEHDGIDRRMHPNITSATDYGKTIVERGVNYRIYAED